MAYVYSAAFLALLAVCGTWAENRCHTQTISSNNFEYKRVTIPGALQVTSVTLVAQRSNSPCVLNTSFGYIGPDVYVDRGCRATFNICYETGYTKLIGCASSNFKESRCNAGGFIVKLTVSKQQSKSPCIENYSYFKDGNFIVVNKGCRADFLVGF